MGETELSYWNELSDSTKALKAFVKEVTDASSDEYIPPQNRIVVFDMDGTLYGEKMPIYIEWCMYVHRVFKDPSFVADSDMLATAEKILNAAKTGRVPEELELEHAVENARAFAGMPLIEYREYVRQFIRGRVNGFSNLTYEQGWFLPMRELIEYLKAKDFIVYICSGTDRYMCRTMIKAVGIDIEPEYIKGMDVTVEASGQNGVDGLEYEFAGDDDIVRTGNLVQKNVKANKVAQTVQEIGKKPILSFGNSVGDVSMHRFVLDNNPYKSMAFMVVADDEKREYGDAQNAEELRAKWARSGFKTISMKDDWKTIYGINVKKEGYKF